MIKLWFFRFIYLGAKIYWFIFHPIYRGAKVVITHRGEMLLIRHSFYPFYWSFPGGAIEKSEDSIQGAIREIKEELGINVSKEDVRDIGFFTNTDEGKKDSIYCFNVEVHNKDFVLNKIELAEARWWPIAEPPHNLGAKNARKIFDLYLEYINKHD